MSFDDDLAEEFSFALNQLRHSIHPKEIQLPRFEPQISERF